jgi:hypothetical protein
VNDDQLRGLGVVINFGRLGGVRMGVVALASRISAENARF